MEFNIFLPLATIVLFAAALICVILIAAIYCRRLYIIRRRHAAQADALSASGPLPKASVVIYTRSEPESLARNLPRMLQQAYPAPFEVIVVNEGASPETSMVVGRLKSDHPNLYLTYTPDGARNLSRKKLALTLGIKAAKGDAVVITDASTVVHSDQWLRLLMEPLAQPGIDVAIGYGTAAVPDQHFAGRKRRAFDLAADNAAWLYSALAGKPYRACGYNLAYRRSLFFDNKGFSRSLNLRQGDDDIFVNEIAGPDNTAVVLADGAMVTKESYAFMRESAEDRLSHAFTGRRLPMGSRRLMAMCEWLMWAVVGCSVAGAVIGGICNAASWGIAAILILAMAIMVGYAWHKTLPVLLAPSMSVGAVWLAMTRPMRNAVLNLHAKMSKSGHYTWQ